MESLLLTLLTALFAGLCLYKARREKPFAASLLPPDVTTALKGIFALTVIFHHLAQRTWAGWIFQNFRGVGYLCVAGFFFLSGYGLQKQVLARPDYLHGFFRRRILPILLPFGIVSVVCWVLSAVVKGRIWYPWDMLTALPWGDTVVPFSWYVISLLVFYPVLALCIKLCRRPQHLPAYIAGYTALCIAFCAAFGFGAFWYNAIPLLPLGMLFAVQEEKLLTFARKRYWLLALPIWLAFLALYPMTDRLMGTQYGSPLCIVLNWLTSTLFAAGLILLLMKVRIGNPVLNYLGKHSLDVDELMKTLGIYEQRNKIPSQLSGGQQQRTSIGRAIVKNPDILLCDEPTGALDYGTSKEILKLIEEINRHYGSTVIMVTHNDAIKNMADKVYKLRDGRIMQEITNETKIPAAELEW